MSADDAMFLAGLPGLAFGFALVLVRVAAAVMLLPGIGEVELPMLLRAALAVMLTLLIMPVVQPLLPVMPGAPAALLALVLTESVTGAWLGWLARMVMFSLPLAGQVAASMLGLTNVLQPDATLGPQTAALSKLFGTVCPVLLFASGLYILPIRAIAGSYALVAPGALWPTGDMAQSAVVAVGSCFALALQFAAPFVLVGAVWHVGLGVLARLVPQLQVYFAAAPGQILGGFILLAALTGGMLVAWRDAAGTALAALPGL